VYASGSGGQALYVIPSADVAIVKFGDSSSYKHEAFLARLLEASPAPGRRASPAGEKRRSEGSTTHADR
jgi:hypothetical protein